MKREEIIKVLKGYIVNNKYLYPSEPEYINASEIEAIADELQAKELTDEEIIASIPYPEAISKHQTDINIGWIRCRKWMRDNIKQL